MHKPCCVSTTGKDSVGGLDEAEVPPRPGPPAGQPPTHTPHTPRPTLNTYHACVPGRPPQIAGALLIVLLLVLR